MKKTLSIVFAFLAVAIMALPTFAATLTKDDIMKELKAGVTVNGVVVTVPEKYTKVAQDFLDANELTQTQIDQVYAEGQKAKEVVKASGVTDLTKLPTAKVNEVMEIAKTAATKVGAKLNFDGKEIKVVDKSGKTFTVAAGNLPIKPTGTDANTSNAVILSVMILAVLSAASVVVFKSRTARNK